MRDTETIRADSVKPEPVIDLSTTAPIDEREHPYDAAERILDLAA